MRAMDPGSFRRWLDRYVDAWRSNEAHDVVPLFAEDAVYSYGPFREETRGRDQIVRRWVDAGVQPRLELSVEPLALEGQRGVAHWRASFDADDGRVELDGILVLDFDRDGRCTLHREWSERRLTEPSEEEG
jgi:hypothetical protein